MDITKEKNIGKLEIEVEEIKDKINSISDAITQPKIEIIKINKKYIEFNTVEQNNITIRIHTLQPNEQLIGAYIIIIENYDKNATINLGCVANDYNDIFNNKDLTSPIKIIKQYEETFYKYAYVFNEKKDIKIKITASSVLKELTQGNIDIYLTIIKP